MGADASGVHPYAGTHLPVAVRVPAPGQCAQAPRSPYAQKLQLLDCGAALAHALTGRYATCLAGADTCPSRTAISHVSMPGATCLRRLSTRGAGGLVDVHQRAWAAPLLAAVGLEALRLPDLLEPVP